MIFLLKKIINYNNVYRVKPLIKDGKFINLDVFYKINKKTYKVSFRDSYLLLPNSLSKLSKSFNNKSIKGIFPYNFVNESSLLYEGIVPDYSYFDNNKVTLEDYLKYKNEFIENNKNWNLIEETIKYCELDCKSLFEVIINFQKEIFSEFKIDITRTPTLPSLAFKIFRTHYLKRNEVPIINGDLYKILSQAFYGGHVDMYIPKGPIHKDNLFSNLKNIILSKFIRHYDINSLYPTGMIFLHFPTGKITYFIPRDNDSINLLNDSLSLGIYRVKINCPENILHPIIPIKINGNCIYPIGSWEGWYHSDELINASKLGYTYEIYEGFLIESKNLFKGYVDLLYNIKMNTDKNNPRYLISKMLLNSLYGRFAMDPQIFSHQIVDKIDPNINYDDIIEFDDKYLVSIPSKNNYLNINIAIGLSVTAYSRIQMSLFKNNTKLTGNVYYSDTDSLYCDKPLPSQYVGKELGKMKLERILTKFIALGPKVYGGIEDNGNSFTKVKGFKNKFTLSELESLLVKDSIIKYQEKWHKDLSHGSIEIKMNPYELKATNVKRKLIYDNNILINTTNYYNNNELK